MRIVFICCVLFSLGVGEDFKKLLCAYPDAILKKENNRVYFQDGSWLLYDDKQQKSKKELLAFSDIEDMLRATYPALKPLHVNRDDSTRVRDTKLFQKLYGSTKKEVMKNLTFVQWLPKTLNKTILFNKRHHAADALQNVSYELDKLDKKYLKFLDNLGGTFNYRAIAKTSRLSMHSFGIAIDLHVKYGNYWLWSSEYENKIPQTIVHIFEKHGFVWGGRWEHFDTMHFEYRPEILFTCKD